MTIVDSCIVLDVLSNDEHSAPAQHALDARLNVGRLFAPDIVFAEVSYGYNRPEEVEAIFEEMRIEVIRLDSRALHRAAMAFKAFKEGRKFDDEPRIAKRILPDFLIGALAEQESVDLLTRDTKRGWNRFFPTLRIISP